MARPPFNPTRKQRRRVELLIGETGEEEIADLLGISRGTLRKHFKRELSHGRMRVLADNLERLDRAASKGNVAAAKALVARKDLAPPGTPAQPRAEKRGKKQEAEIAAQMAEEGTGWAGVIRH